MEFCGGHWGSIDFYVNDKGVAIKHIMEQLGLEPEEVVEVVIIGDSFANRYANDVSMAIEGARVFNVGQPAMEELRGRVIDLEEFLPTIPRGPARTLIILDIIDRILK